MPLRSRETHVLRHYRQGDTGDTDSLGDPREGWVFVGDFRVDAYHPPQQGAGGSDRTRGGVVTDADMVALAPPRTAADIDVGNDRAVLVPLAPVSGTPDDHATAYVIERIRELFGRYASVDAAELHLGREEGADVSQYPTP